MKKRYVVLLLLGVVGLGLFFYNYWSYSCGRCNAESLLTISFPATVLLGINLLALVSLFIVKIRRRRSPDPLQCTCGLRLHPEWQYCPNCGQARI
jgi:hypothetical protein